MIIGAFGPSEVAPRIMTQADALALIQEAERLNASWAAWTFICAAIVEMLVDRSNNGCGIYAHTAYRVGFSHSRTVRSILVLAR